MNKRFVVTVICVLSAFLLAFSLASCDSAGNYADESIKGEIAGENGGNIDLDLENSNIKDDSQYERKIIKTANVSAETKVFDDALGLVEELCASASGYIESSSVRGVSLDSGSNRRYASYTLRIPAENFDLFNEGLGGILNIVSSSSNADEVTASYYDIQSRIEVLELQKESLQTMYDNYTDYKDINSLISLQDKLFAVIEEIESYKTMLRVYDDKVSYSTVHLSINEVIDYTEDTENDTFWQKLGKSISGGWDVFLTIMTGLVTTLAFLLPELVLVAIIITVAIMISKRIKKEKQNSSSDTQKNTDRTKQ